MTTLNPEIIGEINRRIARYKSFRSSRLREKGLEEIKGLDVTWIERVCIGDDYRARPYLEYYHTRIKK